MGPTRFRMTSNALLANFAIVALLQMFCKLVKLKGVHSRKTEVNCSSRLQPINFETLTRVTNNAPCNWVNLVHVSSVCPL